MPFSTRPYRRLPVQCHVTYHAALILRVALAYFPSFGAVITPWLSGPAYGEWVPIAGKVVEEVTEYTVYVEPATIRRNGEVVELWALMDFYAIQTEPSPPYLSVKAQREFHCTEERVRLLALTAFSGNMGSGKVVFSYSDPNDQGISVEPGSVAQSLWKVACSY